MYFRCQSGKEELPGENAKREWFRKPSAFVYFRASVRVRLATFAAATVA
jgi:hypothetical protein